MAIDRYQRLLKQYNRSTVYLTPQDLLQAAVGYFEWCADNCPQEAKVFSYQGETILAEVDKVRAFTKTGLAQHLGITTHKLDSYRSISAKWNEVCVLIDEAIYTQKFENAAAGLLNAALIARDLGLADKTDLSSSDGSMSPATPVTVNMTPKEAASAYNATLNRK